MKIPKIAVAGILSIPLIAVLTINAPQAANPETTQSTSSNTDNSQNSVGNVAIFAGGCFWCVESDFDSVPGVVSTVSGYIGGDSVNPTYKTHSKDRHREAVRITFDPAATTYEKLLEVFWRSVDPTDDGGQFCDRGHSYTTAIYTLDKNQFELATASKATLNDNAGLDKPVITDIAESAEFYPAEDYHQDYYQKNPVRYKLYRKACGRDNAVRNVWGEQAHAGINKH